MLALDLVTAIRREIPGLGAKKLYLLLREPLQKSGITMGRDRLHELLREHRLLMGLGVVKNCLLLTAQLPDHTGRATADCLLQGPLLSAIPS